MRLKTWLGSTSNDVEERSFKVAEKQKDIIFTERQDLLVLLLQKWKRSVKTADLCKGNYVLKILIFRVGVVAQRVKLSLVVLVSRMGTKWNPGCCTSGPAPCRCGADSKG